MKYAIRVTVDHYFEEEVEADSEDDAVEKVRAMMLEWLREEAEAEDLLAEVFDEATGKWQ